MRNITFVVQKTFVFYNPEASEINKVKITVAKMWYTKAFGNESSTSLLVKQLND